MIFYSGELTCHEYLVVLYYLEYGYSWASLVAQMVKNLPTKWETGFNPWIGKIPWRREWVPTPIFLPGEFHGERSLAGHSPWVHKESDITEQLTLLRSLERGQYSGSWTLVSLHLPTVGYREMKTSFAPDLHCFWGKNFKPGSKETWVQVKVMFCH